MPDENTQIPNDEIPELNTQVPKDPNTQKSPKHEFAKCSDRMNRMFRMKNGVRTNFFKILAIL